MKAIFKLEALEQCIPRQGMSYQCRDTDPDLCQNLIICSLAIANLPENFMQIRLEVFAQSC